jgi:hypothetical protein
VLLLVAALMVFAAVISGAVTAATVATPQVIVLKSGLTLGGEGSDYATYGLILRNRSRSQDELNVTVTVKAIDAAGRVFTSDQAQLTLIPAASNFAVDGQLIWDVSIDLKRIAVSVDVGRSMPKGRKLPPVSHITINDPDVTASLTNTYRKALPPDATVYAVFLDGAGKIVNEDDTQTGATLQPGETVPFDLYITDATINLTNPDPITSAVMSVDPCGGISAGTSDCPIAGSITKF